MEIGDPIHPLSSTATRLVGLTLRALFGKVARNASAYFTGVQIRPAHLGRRKNEKKIFTRYRCHGADGPLWLLVGVR